MAGLLRNEEKVGDSKGGEGVSLRGRKEVGEDEGYLEAVGERWPGKKRGGGILPRVELSLPRSNGDDRYEADTDLQIQVFPVGGGQVRPLRDTALGRCSEKSYIGGDNFPPLPKFVVD